MAKRVGKYVPALKKEIKRIKDTIRRYKRQGYIVNFEMPTIPERVTGATVRKFSEIRPRDIRLASTFKTSTGAIIEGSRAFHQKRSQAGKKAYATRQANKRSIERTFVSDGVFPDNREYGRFKEKKFTEEGRLTNEAGLPSNISWNEDVKAYVDYSTGEVLEIDKLPDQHNIVLDNYLKEVGEQILPVDIFNEILDSLEGRIGDTDSWYRRKVKARLKSTDLMHNLAEKIHKIIKDKKANKVYYKNLVEAGKKDELMNAVEKVIYGYDEGEITAGYSVALNILTSGEYMMSASEYNDADEEYEG